MANRNILCVDDEENVLLGFKRHLRKHFDFTAAVGGEDGLKALKSGREFAVIVSDMRMPGMDGIRFLAKAQEICPDSVRMMLTGNADLQTAIDAVNEGHIFRFLTKPCPAENLARALNMGIRQHELVVAERELLRDTLKGSIKVLVDILAMVSPVAFSRAIRIKKLVIPVVADLGLQHSWCYEVAAMLSQLGCVTIPSDIVERAFRGETLRDGEDAMFNRHPDTGKKLIANIPRLEVVAEMIRLQKGNICKTELTEDSPEKQAMTGAQILKAAAGFDLLTNQGYSPANVIQAMRNETETYNARILDILAAHNVKSGAGRKVQLLTIKHLQEGMVLADDLRLGSVLLVAKEQEVNETLLQRLENMWLHKKLDEHQKIAVYQRERPTLNSKEGHVGTYERRALNPDNP